jgi:hypothetical protein
LISDAEGSLLDLKVLTASIPGETYFNVLATFAPLASDL